MMHRTVFALWCPLLLLSGAAAGRSDRPGVALLERLCRPVADSGVAIDLDGARFAPEQARDPAQPVARIDARQSMVLLPGGRFLLRTSTLYPGAIEFRFRTVGSPAGEATIDEIGWRDGDVLQRDDAASAIKDYADLKLLSPAMLACDAKARATTTAADGGLSYIDEAGRSVTLRFASDTGAIASAAVDNDTYSFSEWRDVAGVRQPRAVVRTRDGNESARWTDGSTRPARASDRALLTIPPGYRIADDPGALRATALGAGAFRIDGAASGYHTGFVMGSRDVAVFDAPIGVEDAKAVRALIERAAPGRRIAYVVVSHAHADHVAGLGAYPDAQIVAGAGASVALRRQLGAAMPASYREIIAATTLDLGGRVVRVFAVASAHSSTMLVAFAPASRTIFQGDLFYLPERGATPPAFETGRELADLIRAEKLDVGLIVGVHGRTGKLDDLRHALSLVSSRPNDRGCVGQQLALTGSCAKGS